MTSTHLDFLLCAILVVSLQLQVSSDSSISSEVDDRNALEKQHQFDKHSPRKPPLSCYVCSTMDYEDTSYNPCRLLKAYHKPSTGSHQQSSNIGHLTFMMNHPSASQSTTTLASTTDVSTGITSETIDQSTVHSPMMDAQAPTTHNESPFESLNYQNNFSSTEYDDSQYVNINRTTTISPQPTTLVSSNHGYYPQNKNRAPPAEYIRTRYCEGDENFCSIVSVVRIEFVNDNVMPKFWAMERNCSKSCNTGCMLIGERVRLRVCSQCCKGNNCNNANGSSPISILNLYQLITLALIIAKVSKYAIESD